ncbi:MAG: hypothetical protein NVS1B4_21810 [Gemmatimonadaceae bacterium]
MRRNFVLVMGVTLLALGVYVAVRLILVPGRPLTHSLPIDVAFAAFFIIRGAMNVRAARGR